MKKTITQRSLEERAKFLKKNLHKANLISTPIAVEKKPAVHQLVEKAVNQIEKQAKEEIILSEVSAEFEEE